MTEKLSPNEITYIREWAKSGNEWRHSTLVTLDGWVLRERWGAAPPFPAKSSLRFYVASAAR